MCSFKLMQYTLAISLVIVMIEMLHFLPYVYKRENVLSYLSLLRGRFVPVSILKFLYTLSNKQ